MFFGFDGKYFVAILVIILSFLYWHFTRTFDYWKKKGVFYLKPIVLFGNFKDRMLFRKSFHEFQLDVYKKMKGHKYAGFFQGRRPNLAVLDPELIRHICIRDFNHFEDRSIMQFRGNPLVQKNLLNLKGQQWKRARSILTPAFSSGKLKAMEILIRQCGKQLKQYLDKISDKNNGAILEMKDFFGHFTMDVIATCAFGVQSNSLENPDSDFIKISSKFNDFSIFYRFFLLFVLIIVPQLAKYLPISFFNMEVVHFLANVVRQNKKIRKENNQKRTDFLQLLLDAEEEEQANFDEKVKEGTADSEEMIMDESAVIAQSVLFLIAGFETSGSLLTFASYELAINKDVQDKLRAEIISVFEKHQEENLYEALKEMNYLDMVLHETLRKHPPVARIDRVCTADYVIPNTDVKIEKGTGIFIPLLGLHYDPDYYPEPEKFIPERFSSEQKNTRSPYVYLPFGAGPRNCIGLRFAMLSTKVAMTYLLKDFEINLCPKSEVPYKYNKFAMMLKAKGGIWLQIKPLKS